LDVEGSVEGNREVEEKDEDRDMMIRADGEP